jgi:hypothetical protein
MERYRQLSSIVLGIGLVSAATILAQGQEQRQSVDGRSSIKSSVPPGADLTRAKTLDVSDLFSLPEPPASKRMIRVTKRCVYPLSQIPSGSKRATS